MLQPVAHGPYDNALALAIGANVGTTITAILGSMSSNVQGKRLAGAHLIFNMVTGIIAIAFIYQIGDLVDIVSSTVGIATDDYTLKLAVFHTIFNSIGIIAMMPFIQQLVTFLNRVMPEKVISRAEPKYLNESAIELADTALESVRKETIHLYDNAFAIIAHGLSLHRHDIVSERNLKELVDEPGKPLAIDMENEYNNNVKGLYSEIIEFISKANSTMTAEQSDELFLLRAAGQDIVEAIKDTKHMHNNLVQYIASDNQFIREEYNKLRFGLGWVLRRLEEARADQEDLEDILSMDLVKLKMKEHELEVNETIERLIREGSITAQMATSLMNDTSYAYDVAKDLVQMGEVLFAKGSYEQQAAERSVLLDEEEANEITQIQKMNN